jgi:poly(ADP-ribose) glycohydrolase
MDRLFVSSDAIFYAKLCMFVQYFIRQHTRIQNGDSLSRKLVFSLRSTDSSLSDWEECMDVLQPFVVHPLRASIDDAKDCFRVDFANRYLGGAALSHGCVQEEIMFVLLPELNVGRLFAAKMSDDESIVIQGAEQFSSSTGYGWSFRNAGVYEDPTEVRGGMLQSHIVAMDAVDYRNSSATLQYSDAHILRDVHKSYSGFSATNTPQRIATGNWGCGVFRGNAAFKSLIQWMSASKAMKSIEYFPFDHREIAEEYGALTNLACTKRLRVCDLLFFLRNINPKNPIGVQFKQWVHSC